MPRIEFCKGLSSTTGYPVAAFVTRVASNDSKIEHLLQSRRERRELWLGDDSIISDQEGISVKSTLKEETRREFLQEFTRQCSSAHKSLDTGELSPLRECAMSIVWEVLHTSSLSFVHGGDNYNSLLQIISAAAIYQANAECVREIYYFRCLLTAGRIG